METLSRELLTVIFKHLENRKDVANSRLVSKAWKSSSSRFLIPRVTIAKRLNTLLLLRDIVQHPDLSQNVTELIWDASVYRHFSPSDFDDYVQACKDSGREFEDAQAVQEDEDFVAFCRSVGVACSPLGSRNLSLHESVHRNDDIMHTTGMRKGYADHFERFMFQRRIQDDGTHFATLRLALQRLPRLRKIVFTDFRELTRPGERYNQLCDRMFGCTLEPYGLDKIPDALDAEFDAFKRIVAENPTLDTVVVSVHVHRCGSSQHQYQGPLLYCCEPQFTRVVCNRQDDFQQTPLSTN